mgnify:CR=1 FL=1
MSEIEISDRKLISVIVLCVLLGFLIRMFFDYYPKNLVDFKGEIILGNYNFIFDENLISPLNATNDIIGYTYQNGTIYIETNRSKEAIYNTCIHEVLHNLVYMEDKDIEHDFIFQIEDYVKLDICDELLFMLN